MIKSSRFANLQMLCSNHRIVAKKVYESLYKRYQTSDTDALWLQFGFMSKLFGCTDELSEDAKQAIGNVFNMSTSPSYFLRKHEDGYISVLHDRFCASNIVSYALQYSRNTREHPVIALGYDDEQFVCAAFQNGETILHYCVRRENRTHTVPDTNQIVTFAKLVGCTSEDVLQMIHTDYDEKPKSVSAIFKHDVVISSKDINAIDRSLYAEVSGDGIVMP